MPKIKIVILVGLLGCLSSCMVVNVIKTLAEPEPLKLKDYAPKYYWHGSLNNKTYTLSFDSLDGIWFRANLIVNKNEKISFVGFEKGYTLVTHLKPPVHLFQRQNFDTIRVNQNYGINPYFPGNLILTKKKKYKFNSQ